MSDQNPTYYTDLARFVIHEAVGKLESAQSYLQKASHDADVDTVWECDEVARIIIRLQRVQRSLLFAGGEALSNAARSRR